MVGLMSMRAQYRHCIYIGSVASCTRHLSTTSPELCCEGKNAWCGGCVQTIYIECLLGVAQVGAR